MLLLSVNQQGQGDAAAFSAAYGGVCDGAWCSKRATGRCAALASLNGTQRTQHNTTQRITHLRHLAPPSPTRRQRVAHLRLQLLLADSAHPVVQQQHHAAPSTQG